jgi:hypothetical protein
VADFIEVTERGATYLLNLNSIKKIETFDKGKTCYITFINGDKDMVLNSVSYERMKKLLGVEDKK